MNPDTGSQPSERAGSKSDSTIVLACRHTDASNAIVRGRLELPGLRMRVVESNDVVRLFSGMLRGEYDVSEMSLAEFIYYRSRGTADYIGIPVFPSRVFRHGYIYCNAAANITSPADLSGKKIGFLRWVQTAFVWVRGMLVANYGISPLQTSWYVNSMHHWKDGFENDVTPRDGSTVRLLDRPGSDEYESLCSALIEGELDAIAATENARYPELLAGNEKVTKLFPIARHEEAAYFKRTGIFPIMHVLVAREETLARNPGLAAKLFTLFSESKRLGRQWVSNTPSMSLTWKDEYLDEEQKVFGGDPWPYGLKQNEHVLSTFLSYCHDQGVSATKMEPRDLFARETWDLQEQTKRD